MPEMAVTTAFGWVGAVAGSTSLALTLTLILVFVVFVIFIFLSASSGTAVLLTCGFEGSYLGWLVLVNEGCLGLVQVDSCHLESRHADLLG